MAYQVTIVPATSGLPDAPYTTEYLADFINTTVIPTGTASIVQILENRGSQLILIWDDGV